MARYPTFDEYAKRGNYLDGVNRCDELLKKNINDIRLLILKLQFLNAAGAPTSEWTAVLEELVAIQPPLQDPSDLATIEDAVDTVLQDVHPHPLTAGPVVARLWDNAVKLPTITATAKRNLLTVRFTRAVAENRPIDAQQALIQLKAQQPRNRVVYMAHAAYTQLISTGPNDLQARLAHMLAKKAVSESFETEAPRLDCRVPGQIFALQNSQEGLQSIKDRPRFGESKQVYEALRAEKPHVIAKAAVIAESPDAANVPPKTWLVAEVAELKKTFSELIKQNVEVQIYRDFAANAIRLQHTAIDDLGLAKHRATADACFLAISSLIKVYTLTRDDSTLLRATFLAERLLKAHEYVHEARLILIYLYMRQGLGSLAIRLFESLSVKEIQHDTIGHALFTRLSLTYPYNVPLGRREACDPYERTQRAFTVYARHEDRLAETELRVLEHAQTGMIFDLHQLRHHLRESLTRRMVTLEHRRIARLTKRAPAKASDNCILPRRVANWTTFVDNRDLKAAFNFGLNVEEALYADEDAAFDHRSILALLAADSAWCLVNKEEPIVVDFESLLLNDEDGTVAEPSTTTSNLAPREVDAGHGPRPAAPSASIAAVETKAGNVARRCLAILLLAKNKASIPESTVTALAGAVRDLPCRLLADGAVDGTGVLAEGVAQHALLIDTLLLVHRTCLSAKETLGTIPDELRALQDAVKAPSAQVVDHVVARVKAMKINIVRDALLRDESTRAAIHAHGGVAIQSFVEDMLAAAKDAWTGVSKLQRI